VPPKTAEAACVGGRPSAPIKIEVFSDYQCPACQAFYLQTMRSVLGDYADAGKVCVVYREFPLPMHQYAREAARYGHAAMRLGQREWAQVADALYLSQPQWSQDGKLEAALAQALTDSDLKRLRQSIASPAISAAIESDIALGHKLDINSTPTFFVTAKGKTEKMVGIVQYPILSRYLDYLLGK
jgi:protein-disulfide isomerase